MNIYKTGFCWKCGKLCVDLFCNKKHEDQFKRDLERHVIKGKRAGYGVSGSTH